MTFHSVHDDSIVLLTLNVPTRTAPRHCHHPTHEQSDLHPQVPSLKHADRKPV